METVRSVGLNRPPLWFAVALLPIFFLRRPDAFLKPQFWAEDAYFYHVGLLEGAKGLFDPYSGYLHFYPRIAGLLAAHANPLLAPSILNGFSILALVLLAISIFREGNPLPHKMWLALVPVLHPQVYEIFFSVTNAQSILGLVLAVLLIMRDPPSTFGLVWDTTIALVIGLTGVYSVLLAPLFILRAIQRQTAQSIILAVAVAIAAAVQAYFVLRSMAPVTPDVPFEWGRVVTVVGQMMGVSLFGLGHSRFDVPEIVLFVAGVGVGAALVFAAFAPGDFRRERMLLAVISTLYFAASVFRLRTNLPALASAERYTFAPSSMFLWLLVLAPWHRLVTPLFCWICPTAYCLTALASFRITPLTDFNWPEYAPRIRQDAPVRIPINPEGWFFDYQGENKGR